MHEYRFGSSTSYRWFVSWERFGSSISYLSLIWIISHCIWNDVPRYSYSSLGTKFPERALRPCSTFEADKAQTSQSYLSSSTSRHSEMFFKSRQSSMKNNNSFRHSKNWFQLRWRAKHTQWQLFEVPWTEQHHGNTSSNLQSSKHTFEWGNSCQGRLHNQRLRKRKIQKYDPAMLTFLTENVW